MKQAVLVGPGRIEFREIERPKPDADEVIVRIGRIGICGSDIHVFHGTHPYTGYPIVQGHEVSGIVIELGRDVAGLSLGTKVTFQPQVTCGTCYSCTHGMYHICNSLRVMGFQTDGAAQEYFAVPADLIVPLPDSMSLELGAMVEPTAVAVHALSRAGEIAGKRVLVLGAGTIGNLVGQVSRGLGARQVIITDLSDFRLVTAKECGIDFSVNPAKEDVEECLLNNFGEDRADVILECVGAQETITQAVNSARKGSTIVVVGVFGKKPVVDIGLVQDRELSLVGTLMYQRKDYEKAVDLLQRNAVNAGKLITDTFTFHQYPDAYRELERAKDRTIKAMISLD